ncbi:hypothetical protein HZS_3470 [Henneguya salminicola]|nr:hypothetical protein HZS_3470 [Henneguya salminicola]
MKDRFNYEDFYCRKNSQKNGKFYYICRKRDSTRCSARLIVSGNTITMKGFNICSGEKQILTNQIPKRVPDDFVKKHIDKKSLCLELYPSQIHEKLFGQIREQFSDIPCQIPSKKWVFAIIRENRGASNFNAIQAISTPSFSLNRNAQPFFLEGIG